MNTSAAMAAANLNQQQQQQRNPLFNRDRTRFGDVSLSSGMNAFDPSEFPSLGQNALPNSAMAARSNYGLGMVKQPAMETNEFTMSHEDFPALPGSNRGSGNSNNVDEGNMESRSINNYSFQGGETTATTTAANGTSESQQQERRGIQTSPDGTVKNIPPSMVTDQFGMIGLLTFIRAAETDPNLVSLALGADLTTLGLNLTSEVSLYPTFGGPWAETPCRPQDIDFHVPSEYLTNQTIREKLAPVKLNRYKDDVLFYMFYTSTGDVLQLAAAAELYNREWRYHREDRIWITRAPGMPPSEKTNTYERGTYYFFDAINWRKVTKEFHLDYEKLEDRPTLPPTLSGGSSSGNGGGSVGVVPPSLPPGPPPPPSGGYLPPGGPTRGAAVNAASAGLPTFDARRTTHSPSAHIGEQRQF